jgi:tRNA G18 (ribose-2'-O)-methylase SpoU
VIEPISSGDDPRLEPYRRVGDPGWLRRQGLFVAEGRFLVGRLAAERPHDIASVLVTPSALTALAPALPAVSVFVAAPAILERITGFNFHRGCLAIAARPAPAALTAFDAARRLVVLERVGNPDNVGGIFRSAAALGADGVVLDPGSGDPFYRKAVRTSMGAVLRLPHAVADRWPSALEDLRSAGFLVAALSPSAPAAVTVDAFVRGLDRRERIAVMAGSEGEGLTPSALALADVAVRIPIDERSDSLNVVVAVAIVLERLRNRDRADRGDDSGPADHPR